eukprot:6176171-Amphidinium_carterae.2
MSIALGTRRSVNELVLAVLAVENMVGRWGSLLRGSWQQGTLQTRLNMLRFALLWKIGDKQGEICRTDLLMKHLQHWRGLCETWKVRKLEKGQRVIAALATARKHSFLQNKL